MAKEKEIQYPRKITIKAIGIKVDLEELLKKEGKRMMVADIVGVVTKAKPGTSEFGDYVRFLGQFQATNLLTGDVYQSAVCLLPKFLEEGLFGALGTDGAQSVEFAVRLSVKYVADAAAKYEYEAKSLIPAKEADALAQLVKRAQDQVKLLEKK